MKSKDKKEDKDSKIVIPKELLQSAKVSVQLALLTVSYSVGYGIGAGGRCLSAVVNNSPRLGFMKEMAKEVRKGYTVGSTEKEPANVVKT